MASQLPRYQAMLEGVAHEKSLEVKITMLGAFQETVQGMNLNDAVSVLEPLEQMLEGSTSAADPLRVALKSEVLTTMAVIHTLIDFPHRKHDVFCKFVDLCFSWITKSNDDTNVQLRSCAAMALLELELAYPGIFIKESTVMTNLAKKERTSAVTAYTSLAISMASSAVKVASRRSRVEPIIHSDPHQTETSINYNYKLPATYLSYPLQLKSPSPSENVVNGALPYKSNLIELIQLLPTVALSVCLSLASAIFITSKSLSIEKQHIHKVFAYICRGLVSGKTVTGKNLESVALAGMCRHVVPGFLADEGATLMIQLGLIDPTADTLHQYIHFKWRRELSIAIVEKSGGELDQNSLVSPLRMGGVISMYHPVVVFEAVAAAPTAVRDPSHIAELLSPISVALSKYNYTGDISSVFSSEVFIKPWYHWICLSQYCGGRVATIQILVNLLLHRSDDSLLTSAVHKTLNMFKKNNTEQWVHGELPLILLQTAINRGGCALGNMLEFVGSFLEWGTTPRASMRHSTSSFESNSATPLDICGLLSQWMKVRSSSRWREDNAVLNMIEIAVKQAKLPLRNQLCGCIADLIPSFSSTAVRLQAVMLVNEETTGSFERQHTDITKMDELLYCSERHCPEGHLCSYGYISSELVECCVCCKHVEPMITFYCEQEHESSSLPTTPNSTSLSVNQSKLTCPLGKVSRLTNGSYFECLDCAQIATLTSTTRFGSSSVPSGLSLQRTGSAKFISSNENNKTSEMQLDLSLQLADEVDSLNKMYGITISFTTSTAADTVSYKSAFHIVEEDIPTLEVSVLSSGDCIPLKLTIVQKQPFDVVLNPTLKFTAISSDRVWEEREVSLPTLRITAVDNLLPYGGGSDNDEDLLVVYKELSQKCYKNKSKSHEKEGNWVSSRTNILSSATERLEVLNCFKVSDCESDEYLTSEYLISTAGGHTLLIEAIILNDTATLTTMTDFWLLLPLVDSLFSEVTEDSESG